MLHGKRKVISRELPKKSSRTASTASRKMRRLLTRSNIRRSS